MFYSVLTLKFTTLLVSIFFSFFVQKKCVSEILPTQVGNTFYLLMLKQCMCVFCFQLMSDPRNHTDCCTAAVHHLKSCSSSFHLITIFINIYFPTCLNQAFTKHFLLLHALWTDCCSFCSFSGKYHFKGTGKKIQNRYADMQRDVF